MNMRLLWAWSNGFAHWGRNFSWPVRFYQILAVLLTLVRFSAFALERSSLESERIWIELGWSAGTQSFKGTQFLFIPRSRALNARESSDKRGGEDAIEFWILPNRDLHEVEKNTVTREQREFRKNFPAIEWPHLEMGLGALTVQRVERHDSAMNCSQVLALGRGGIPRDGWNAAPFERRDWERRLKVDLEPSTRDGSSCLLLKVTFEFFPHEGLGNFAMHSATHGIFSGPIYPLPGARPMHTTLWFHDPTGQTQLSCDGCMLEGEAEVKVEFLGLPPVLTLQSRKDFLKSHNLADRTFNIIGLSGSSKKTTELSASVAELIDHFRPAVERFERSSGRVWTVRVSPGALLERLVSEQRGDVQMSLAYGEFGFFLTSYQQAALFRALARNFLRITLEQAQLDSSPTWAMQEQNERWARIIAELWVIHFFPDIYKIRELSARFSFLPFFKDIQSGKALLNNNVFIGKEESGPSSDFSLYDEFFEPMSGSDLLNRLKACAREEDFSRISEIAVEVALASSVVADLQRYVLDATPIPDCQILLQQGLLPQDVPAEHVRIDKKANTLLLTRELEKMPASKRFLMYAKQRIVREDFVVQTKQNDDLQRVTLPAPTSELRQTYPLVLNNVDSVRVLEPVRSSQTARTVWPRPIRSVLQSVSANFDSARNDLSLKSQVLFYQEGDDWSRNVALGFKRALSKNQALVQFSSQVPSMLPSFDSRIVLESNVELKQKYPVFFSLMLDVSDFESGVLYPEGVFFQGRLKRPLSFSAFNEPMIDPNKELTFGYSVGLAPRLTWKESFTYGSSDLGLDVGVRDLPAWPAEEFTSREYGLIRSEIIHTLAHNLVMPLMRSIIFQHAVVFASHVLAFDAIEPPQKQKLGGRTAHSVSSGIRFYGAFFGSKNQMLSFEVARGFPEKPVTSYSFSVGRSIN